MSARTETPWRPLEGHVALVTGCGRAKGLGRGIALALARAGADIVVTDVEPLGTRNALEAETDEARTGWRGVASGVEEIQALGRRAIAVLGDVGRSQDVDRMTAEAVERLGRVDVLVNNAAAPHGPDRNWSWQVPEAAFDEVLRVNTKGVFLMSGAIIRHLLGRGAPGRIINIASVAAKRGFPQRAAYVASKFAVMGLTETLAQEVAARGITVNAICPGVMETSREASRRGRQAAAGPDAGVMAAAPQALVTRLGTAEDIGRAAVFLADPAASFITGQALVVDGGLMLKWATAQ